MSLYEELGLNKPFVNRAHETLLNIVLTGSLLMKEARRVLKPYGLTEAHFNILMLLEHQCEDEQINQTELGRMLLVNRSNVTGLIDRMEQAGLVIRMPDAEDRRVHQVKLTEKGRDVLRKCQTIYYRRIEEVMSVLPVGRRDLLIGSLETLRDRVKRS